MCPKYVDGMANSIDPDQTDLGLHRLLIGPSIKNLFAVPLPTHF